MQDLTFKKYYQHYLTLHRHPINRFLHVVGNLSTLVFVIGCLYYKNYLLLILTPFIVYPFAWSGHFFFEKNKPAAFSKPIWAKACDWVMMWNMLKNILSRGKK
tara:strand:+ start:641 stop:949 length:309 start_codon:yes stop_codon:yes gene_type:complete